MKSTKRSRGGGAECFPPEIMEEILLRLPVESLIRFKTVSKKWLGLIKSTDFIKMHLNRSKMANNYFSLSLVQYDNGMSHELALLRDETGSFDYPEIPFVEKFQDFSVEVILIGSVNGLVCFYFELRDEFVKLERHIALCNLATKQKRLLPTALFPLSYRYPDFYDVVFGFGLHPEINDYFVLRIMEGRDNALIGAVWIMGRDYWEEIQNVPQVSLNEYYSSASVVVNGVWYHVASDQGPESSREFILCFNVVDQVFWELGLPQIIEDRMFRKDLTEYKGLLALSVQHKSVHKIDIWLLKDDSWMKHITIEPFVQPTEIIGCWKNTKFLLAEIDYANWSALVNPKLYDPLTRNLRTVSEGRRVGGMAHSYVESLVSVYPV